MSTSAPRAHTGWSGGSAVAGSQAIYDDILRAPDDDAPRVAYASLLEASGLGVADEHRARMIRAQLELAALRRQGRWMPKPSALAKELVRRHRAAWLGPIADYGRDHRFRRGFVDQITLDARAFVNVADAVFRLAPIRHLALLVSRRADLDAACQSGHLRRMRSLSVRGPIGDAGLAALVACHDLDSLRWLDVSDCDAGVDALVAIASAPTMSQLGYLGFYDNRVPSPRPEPDIDHSSGEIVGYEPTPIPTPLRSFVGKRAWLSPPTARYLPLEPPDRDDLL